MKSFILGVVMLFCGIMGCVGMFITEAINHAGHGGNLWDVFWQDGIVIPLIIFALLTVIGLIKAFIGSNDKNETITGSIKRLIDEPYPNDK